MKGNVRDIPRVSGSRASSSHRPVEDPSESEESESDNEPAGIITVPASRLWEIVEGFVAPPIVYNVQAEAHS